MTALFTILKTVGFSLINNLICEKVIKMIVIAGLKYAVKRTKTDIDDKVLEEVLKKWN